MSDEEKLSKWIEENGCSEDCDYCIWACDCPKGMVCYGGEPIEPRCFGDNPEDFLDMDAILQDLKEKEVGKNDMS